MNKKLKVGERTVNLSIWDTAGQERFHALGPIYYRDAQGRQAQTVYVYFYFRIFHSRKVRESTLGES